MGELLCNTGTLCYLLSSDMFCFSPKRKKVLSRNQDMYFLKNNSATYFIMYKAMILTLITQVEKFCTFYVHGIFITRQGFTRYSISNN